MARGAVASLIAVAVSGCTLITDIDREKIPNPPLPVFPEVDAGPQPDLDASSPHPPLGPDAAPPVDAGDGGAADGGALDAGLEDASAGS
ncbi:MAG TPA: hypothetical protein VNN80_31600 [Polyangiaceae bacterium]|nr:hypothetical protein [Polyangiaceae bacterium]